MAIHPLHHIRSEFNYFFPNILTRSVALANASQTYDASIEHRVSSIEYHGIEHNAGIK